MLASSGSGTSIPDRSSSFGRALGSTPATAGCRSGVNIVLRGASTLPLSAATISYWISRSSARISAADAKPLSRPERGGAQQEAVQRIELVERGIFGRTGQGYWDSVALLLEVSAQNGKSTADRYRRMRRTVPIRPPQAPDSPLCRSAARRHAYLINRAEIDELYGAFTC